MSAGRGAWVPLHLSRESFIAAEKRLNQDVRVGMSRGEFFQAMKLNPLAGGDGEAQLVAGEGWFSDISRRNRVGEVEIEEYSFGYFESYRLKERFAVILEKGAVARIVRSPWPDGYAPPQPPGALTASLVSLEEETRLIQAFYQERLQSRASFEQILPHLRRVRPGWTSAELRLALGGSLYRLSNGLVYFQEGLLWGNGFTETTNGPLPVVILPFGYRTSDGRVHTEVIVRAEGGFVTAVFWQEDARRGSSPGGERK